MIAKKLIAIELKSRQGKCNVSQQTVHGSRLGGTNFSLRRTKFEKRIRWRARKQPRPGQLGDWDLRDNFA